MSPGAGVLRAVGYEMTESGLPQAATGAAFASAVGLCLFAAHPQDEWWDFEIPPERFAEVCGHLAFGVARSEHVDRLAGGRGALQDGSGDRTDVGGFKR